MEAHPQHSGEDRTESGHDDVFERRPDIDDLPGAERIVGDDREVDERERDERTEVDERRDELEAERHREEAHGADEDDVEHRSVRARIDVAEGLARQDAVAAHDEEHARDRGMRGQARGDGRGERGGNEEELEERAARE
ncbi:Uncharacterised protein [Mycobacteroides abscessus subsp. abscessus]|nr:Uncharacterised protein [Mycobacteroides abscessus subsp. abscessus]